MNIGAPTIFLLLLAGVGLAIALHWLIGAAQRKLIAHYVGHAPIAAGEPPSIKRLLFNWTGNAVRTVLWLFFLAFVIHLAPQTRARFDSISDRLAVTWEKIVEWLFDRGISILIIIVATIFLMRFSSAIIRTIFAVLERGASDRDELAARRRLNTISTILNGVSQTVISFIGLMTLLQQLHVDITPILASAGIVGLAVGFGAQSLIRDLFSGLLILIEDQYNVGDRVQIGAVEGNVEHISLRSTRVRGTNGSLTIIPNGSIAIVANLSKDWSRVVLDIDVGYSVDVDRAMNLMRETAVELMKERPQEIIEEPKMLGVDKMTANHLTLRLTVKTAPNKQFSIGRELRRRIALAFEREGIKTP